MDNQKETKETKETTGAKAPGRESDASRIKRAEKRISQLEAKTARLEQVIFGTVQPSDS